MFKLLRYFSITGLIAMVIAAVILGTFYRHMAIRDLIKTSEYRMGGSLPCGSEGIGKGATFILELPFNPAEMVA